jgi:hypothetical protein
MSNLFSTDIYNNLGFGDYDIESDRLLDAPVSNNGDHYRVFNTVLNTIPNFFSFFPTAIMAVQGSDSTGDFLEQCRVNCSKDCGKGECRNAHRRINIYRRYVDKHFEGLSAEYAFYGGEKDTDNQITIEPYQIGKRYDSVLVSKKLYL